MRNLLNPARHCQGGCGARALYLGGGDRKTVTCSAEALVVRNERQQTLRYPLARVARVVSSTGVTWSGAALALCLQNGIGISWVSAKGEALGTCYPHQRCPPVLATALELWLEASLGAERYQDWLRGRRMDVLVRWARTGPGGVGPQQWESAKRAWVYAATFRQHLPAALRGHLLAYVGSRMARAGAPPLLWDCGGTPVHLDADLCQLLWAEMNLGTGDLADNTGAEGEIVALFERWIACNGAALELHLSSLQRTALKANCE